MILIARRFIVLLLLIVAAPAWAQPAADPLQQRADDIVRVIRGEGDPTAIFSPAFIAQVPPAQIRAISGQLVAGNGAIQRVERIERASPLSGTVFVGFERNIVAMRIAIEAQAPHLVSQLLVTGSEPRGGDSAEAIIGELRQLPGQVNFQIARLGEGAATSIAALEPERALAVGSTFKLVILAEIGRQVRAGQRRWRDVVPVDRHSLPSGILQDWPLGSPVTLHTLASLMISRSDNTATDVLLRVAGRENVERMMTRMNLAHPARNRPYLSTMELFQLKADAPEVLARWRQSDEAARRRLLQERYEQGSASIEMSRLFAAGPTAIDSVEWFFSPADLVRVMDWLRRNGDDEVKAILAINPGLGAEAARPFSYMGFKGGSEPGVINLTFLIRNNAGRWHVVTGSWNNPAAAVDEARFVGLMGRAVNLVR